MLSATDADSKLSRSDIQLALYIPQGFSDKLAANQPAQLIFKQRGNGGTEGQIVANLVRGAAEGISQELQVQTQVKTALANTNISSSADRSNRPKIPGARGIGSRLSVSLKRRWAAVLIRLTSFFPAS